MRPLARAGFALITIAFFVGLIVAAWADAPEFLRFISNNKIILTSVGVALIAAGFIKSIVIVLAILVAVFLTLKLLGV